MQRCPSVAGQNECDATASNVEGLLPTEFLQICLPRGCLQAGVIAVACRHSLSCEPVETALEDTTLHRYMRNPSMHQFSSAANVVQLHKPRGCGSPELEHRRGLRRRKSRRGF